MSERNMERIWIAIFVIIMFTLLMFAAQTEQGIFNG